MATPSEVAAYRQAQADVVALAHDELTSWWAALGTTNLATIKAALEVFLPELVAIFGDIAATVAADWFGTLREQADVPGTFLAVLGAVIPAEQAQATARWAGSADSPEQVLGRVTGSVQRYVQQGGRNTLARNMDADPAKPRWARAPSGADTCAWCRILSSRGAVYLSEQSAGGLDNDWHDDCNCQPVPVWHGQQEPYDVATLYQQYKAAVAEAGSGDPADIASAMRSQLSIR